MTPSPLSRQARDRALRRIAGSAAASLLLAACLVLLVDSSRHASATVDEPAHLTAGYLALARGDRGINREHPPLAKELAAAPLLLMHPVIPERDAAGPEPGTEDFEFDYSRRFLYKANDADRLLRVARVPIMLLAVLLGAVVYVWCRALAGTAAALCALLLFVLEPNILAHGRLVTTDLGAAAFAVAFLWTLRMVSRRGSALAAAACGIFLGCALLTKFSTLLLLPVAALLLAADRAPFLSPHGAAPRPSPGRLLNLAGVVLFAAWVVLLAGYRFGGFPLPDLYLQGIEMARHKNAAVEGPTYLMGKISPDGFWSYYLIALAVKTPIPLLALAGLGAGAWLARRETRLDATWILLPAVAWIAAMTVLTKAQIGLRYVLPATPMLCIAAGLGARSLLDLRARAGGGPARAVPILLLAGLLVWGVAGEVRAHPYELAYFNEIAGGSDRGWLWLVDSNLDWGQDLGGLAAWLAGRGRPEVNLYYFGTADPDYYAIRKRPYGAPAPGLFAVSATHLAGVYLPDPDYLGAFRTMEPVARIGHSIFVYDVAEVPPRLLRRAALRKPAAPPMVQRAPQAAEDRRDAAGAPPPARDDEHRCVSACRNRDRRAHADRPAGSG